MLAGRESIAALCHNDLHHLNILDDGERLWLVDWEYGGCGDPLFDLASFLCQHESTHEERQVLLGAYAGDSGISIDLVEAACRAFDYVQWLWYRLRGANDPDVPPGTRLERRRFRSDCSLAPYPERRGPVVCGPGGVHKACCAAIMADPTGTTR